MAEHSYEEKEFKIKANEATTEKEMQPKTLKHYSSEEFDKLSAKEQTRLFAESIVRNLNTHDPKEV